jgi:predicted flap endonuclease-1-like 5' DNA nuclease
MNNLQGVSVEPELEVHSDEERKEESSEYGVKDRVVELHRRVAKVRMARQNRSMSVSRTSPDKTDERESVKESGSDDDISQFSGMGQAFHDSIEAIRQAASRVDTCNKS